MYIVINADSRNKTDYKVLSVKMSGKGSTLSSHELSKLIEHVYGVSIVEKYKHLSTHTYGL